MLGWSLLRIGPTESRAVNITHTGRITAELAVEIDRALQDRSQQLLHERPVPTAKVPVGAARP